MLYFVRCDRGVSLPIFGFASMLTHLRACGPSAIAYDIFGAPVAGRTQEI